MSSETSALLALVGVFSLACMVTFMIGVRRGRAAELRRWKAEYGDKTDLEPHHERDRHFPSVPSFSALITTIILVIIVIAGLLAVFFASSR